MVICMCWPCLYKICSTSLLSKCFEWLVRLERVHMTLILCCQLLTQYVVPDIYTLLQLQYYSDTTDRKLWQAVLRVTIPRYHVKSITNESRCCMAGWRFCPINSRVLQIRRVQEALRIPSSGESEAIYTWLEVNCPKIKANCTFVLLHVTQITDVC